MSYRRHMNERALTSAVDRMDVRQGYWPAQFGMLSGMTSTAALRRLCDLFELLSSGEEEVLVARGLGHQLRRTSRFGWLRGSIWLAFLSGMTASVVLLNVSAAARSVGLFSIALGIGFVSLGLLGGSLVSMQVMFPTQYLTAVFVGHVAFVAWLYGDRKAPLRRARANDYLASTVVAARRLYAVYAGSRWRSVLPHVEHELLGIAASLMHPVAKLGSAPTDVERAAHVDLLRDVALVLAADRLDVVPHVVKSRSSSEHEHVDERRLLQVIGSVPDRPKVWILLSTGIATASLGLSVLSLVTP